MIKTALLLMSVSFATAFASNECTNDWKRYDETPYVEQGFPDTHVTYWRYRFETNDDLTFKITGAFPHARYSSFVVYNQETLDYTDGIYDAEIVPDQGSENPYIEHVSRQVPHRNYTISMVPAGHKSGKNQIEMPRRAGEKIYVDLWYRIYSPDDGAYPYGNVSLPKIEAFKNSTPVNCPTPTILTPNFTTEIKNLPPSFPGGRVRFFHPTPSGINSNADNGYLVAQLPELREKPAVISFLAPKNPTTNAGGGEWKEDYEVRYWSLCLGGLTTQTSACLSDEKAKRDADGIVTVVIGPPDAEASAIEKGQNFVPIGDFRDSVVLYRNVLAKPDFKGNISKVPFSPPNILFRFREASHFIADLFIGDYAPSGERCNLRRFLADECGLGF